MFYPGYCLLSGITVNNCHGGARSSIELTRFLDVEAPVCLPRVITWIVT